MYLDDSGTERREMSASKTKTPNRSSQCGAHGSSMLAWRDLTHMSLPLLIRTATFIGRGEQFRRPILCGRSSAAGGDDGGGDARGCYSGAPRAVPPCLNASLSFPVATDLRSPSRSLVACRCLVFFLPHIRRSPPLRIRWCAARDLRPRALPPLNLTTSLLPLSARRIARRASRRHARRLLPRPQHNQSMTGMKIRRCFTMMLRCESAAGACGQGAARQAECCCCSGMCSGGYVSGLAALLPKLAAASLRARGTLGQLGEHLGKRAPHVEHSGAMHVIFLALVILWNGDTGHAGRCWLLG